MDELLPTTRDLLVLIGVAAAVYVALIAGAKALRRVRGVRFRWIFHAFALAIGLLIGAQLTTAEFPLREQVVHHLSAAALILAAFPLGTLLNRFLWVGTRATPDKLASPAPRLLADTTNLVVFVVLTLVVLQFVYDLQVPGLLAGSGVAAIVLGLAMQDLLANTLAGIALFVEKPFKTGDWLLIDGHEARVVEVTWRSTRLLTDDDVFLDVPNRKVFEESIINYHQPDSRHALRTEIGLHYDVPPERARDVLMRAAWQVKNVCPDRAPDVWVKEFADSSIVYEIEVWVDDHGVFKQVLSDVRSHCWYAVKRAGFEIPYPQMTLHRPAPPPSVAQTRAVAAASLRAHAIFGGLAVEHIDELMQRSRVVLFAPDESIIVQGAAGASMFLLVHGRVDVSIARDGQTRVVAQLGPGDCIGEMSLLTGDARNATVAAVTEVEAVEIAKAAFAELVQAHPEMLVRLSELLAQRQLANEKLAAAEKTPARVEQTRANFLRRLTNFFALDE